MQRFVDRTVVVAGAATGIGAASAVRLAEEGAKVVVGDVDRAGAERTVARIRESGGTAEAIPYDQSDERSVAELVAQSVERFGAIHALHANAADTRPEVQGRDLDVGQMDVAIWERTLRVNLIGYALLVREALPHLLAAGGGGIVCTTSDASVQGLPVLAAYSAAKAGVNALVRHVASRWGKDGIRCNAISPGYVLTEAGVRDLTEEGKEMLLSGHRSPRLGVPGDVAGCVAYLLSDEGSWVNGQVWSVDGGLVLRD